ncbi:RDD family protein [Actinoplanes subglobosus]|uniref:RDD family protein n=1 Tax=Actinoplanes subglobosus TaxID=1547892 RepID=A0ABV8IL11_9ACTN
MSQYVPDPAGYHPRPPVPAPYSGYQPVAREMVSRSGRLGASLLDSLLIILTLGIGWLIWALLVFGRAQTPARQMLGHVVADATTGQPLDWGRTALRELVIKGIVGYVGSVLTCGVYPIVDALFIFNDRRQTLHDMMASTIVVHLYD